MSQRTNNTAETIRDTPEAGPIANPEYLHRIFDDHGGFDGFHKLLNEQSLIPRRAARLIWDNPDRRQLNRRNRWYLTAGDSFMIADTLDIPWPELMEGFYGPRGATK